MRSGFLWTVSLRCSTPGLVVLAILVALFLAGPAAGREERPLPLHEVRVLFSRGEFDRAAALLEKHRKSFTAASEVIDREEVAFYLGLCAEGQDDYAAARKWYEAARSLAVKNDRKDRLPFYHLVLIGSGGGESSFISTGEEHFCADEKDHEKFLKIAWDQRLEAKKAFDAAAAKPEDQKLLKKISFVTWSLILAELGSFGAWAAPDAPLGPEGTLYSIAVTQFRTNWKELDKIEQDIKESAKKPKGPDLEKTISENVAVAMQIDSVRVRLNKIIQKYEKVEEKQQERIEKLKILTTNYRDSTEQLSVAVSRALLQDHASASKDITKASESVKKVKDVIVKKDFWLFEKEPGVDEAYYKPADDSFRAFSNNFEAQFLAIQAMMAFTNAVADPRKPNTKDLEGKVLPLAAAAQEIEAGNPLALFAQASANESLGVAKARANPKDAEVQKHFKAAKGELDELELKTAGNKGFARVHQEAILRKKKLLEPAFFLQEANALTQAGKLEQAHAVLQEGAERHFVADIWLARADTELRGRFATPDAVKADLDNGSKGGIIPADQYHFARAKALLAGLHQDMPKDNREEEWTEEIKARLSERAAKIADVFKEAQENAKDDITRARCKAFRSYALSLTGLPKQVDPTSNESLLDGDKLSGEAYNDLDSQLKKLDPKSAAFIEVREAIIASTLAKGRLSIQLRPKYNPAAFDAFTLSVDQSAKLPFSNEEWKVSLGNPLLDVIKNRPDNAGDQFAREEQKLRRAYTHFGEGALALHQGAADAAARHAVAGLDIIDAKTKPGPFAKEELDDLLSLRRDELIALKALGELASAQEKKISPDIALVTVMTKFLPSVKADPNSAAKLPEAAINKAVKTVNSPILAYALGRALEEKAVWIRQRNKYSSDTESSLLLALAAKSYHRIENDLRSETMKARFPLLVPLTAESIARLEEPSHYLDVAAIHREKFRLHDTKAVLKEGMTRHLDNPNIWYNFLQVSADLAELGLSSKAQDDEVFDIVRNVHPTASKDIQAVLKLWEGDIAVRRENFQHAAEAYKTAITLADTDDIRVRATTRLTSANLKMIPAR